MGIETFTLADMDYAVGDTVIVKTGPFAESTGIVKEVNIGKRSVVVGISIFGRETPMELDFNQVQPL